MPDPTPEQRVAEAIDEADAETLDYERRSPDDGYGSHAAAALDAVRAALTSDAPEVVRAMAERVGLEVDTDRAIPLPCGHFAGARIKRIRVSGPWREVPDAD